MQKEKVNCRKCYSSNTWKWGFTYNGKQKYICKSCGYVWSE